MIQPYADAIEPAQSIDDLKTWLNQVLYEDEKTKIHNNKVIEAAGLSPQVKLTTAKNMIFEFLIDQMTNNFLHDEDFDGKWHMSPWELAMETYEPRVRFFGPSTDRLPVTVTIGNNSFTHLLTKEFAYGILKGLAHVHGYTLTFLNVPLTEDLFEYEPTKKEKRYTAIVNGTPVLFNAPEFIQGIVTAAQWRNVDPHIIVTSLVDNQNGEPILF